MVFGTYMQKSFDSGIVMYFYFYFTIARGCPRLSAAATSLPPLSLSTIYPSSDHLSRTPHAVLFLLFSSEIMKSITS